MIKLQKTYICSTNEQIFFTIGDNVSVIDNMITGVITSVNGKIIQLEDENGFNYQYHANEIVLQADKLFENLKVKIKDKSIVKKNKSLSKTKNKLVLEVDLHIHQITKSNKYLSNSEMLLKQLAHAKTKLKLAINNNISKVIFIHGIGQGILKTEILYLLKEFPVQINDASYRKYGKGAMEVTIYRSKV